MSKYLCADCGLREQCDCEWTMRCSRYVPKEHKLTNEEHLKSLDTEQLAEILVYMAEDKNEAKTVHKENVGKCVWWLKQPHKDTK